MLWILRTRITSSSARLTAAEYVLAPKTRVAVSSSGASNTRFVRFMCIVYRSDFRPASIHRTRRRPLGFASKSYSAVGGTGILACALSSTTNAPARMPVPPHLTPPLPVPCAAALSSSEIPAVPRPETPSPAARKHPRRRASWTGAAPFHRALPGPD